jgi:hypothetical protein
MMNCESVSGLQAGRDRAEPVQVYLHGDLIENFTVGDWQGAEPVSGYLCRACDLILPAEHFKTHSREQHLARYKADYRRLARLAALGPIIRGGDPDENLIERALRRERELRDRTMAETVGSVRRVIRNRGQPVPA